jgi:hypothetical protein
MHSQCDTNRSFETSKSEYNNLTPIDTFPQFLEIFDEHTNGYKPGEQHNQIDVNGDN